jgi:hypothetical protein
MALNNAVVANGGDHQQNVTFTLNTNNITAGDLLLVRWYPTLTTASTQPGPGTTYGEFRTNAIESGSTINWTVPADGTNNNLSFLTATYGGAEPDAAGRASLTVSAVPEPSSYISAVLGLAGLGVTILRRRLKK